jgi:hypothetical protein
MKLFRRPGFEPDLQFSLARRHHGIKRLTVPFTKDMNDMPGAIPEVAAKVRLNCMQHTALGRQSG